MANNAQGQLKELTPRSADRCHGLIYCLNVLKGAQNWDWQETIVKLFCTVPDISDGGPLGFSNANWPQRFNHLFIGLMYAALK